MSTHVSVTSKPVRVTARAGVNATVSVATGPRGQAPWVALTQAEYNAIQREAGTLYLITDRVGP